MITSAGALRIAHRISTEFPVDFDRAASMVETMRRDLHEIRRPVDPVALKLEIVGNRLIASDDGFPVASAWIERPGAAPIAVVRR